MLAANFESDGSWVARLADMGVDTFFDTSNDLVVPTAGGWDSGPFGPDGNLPTDQIGCFGPGGNLDSGDFAPVHHLNFFAHPASRELIVNALSGESLGLPPMSATPPRRRAAARLVAVAAATDKVAAARAKAAAAGVAAEPVEDAWAESRKLFAPYGWSGGGRLTAHGSTRRRRL